MTGSRLASLGTGGRPSRAWGWGVLVSAVFGTAAGCGKPAREAAVAASPAAVAAPWFEDVTDRSGVTFVHATSPKPERYFLPDVIGSGASLFDLDGDGRLDVYLVQNGGPGSGTLNRLYRQNADGRFEDVSDGSGLDVDGYGMGVAVGDVNNDGRPDVFLTEYGRARLFLNAGGWKFRDVTPESGIDNPYWGTSAAFFDYDRDGWLDLAVANYVDYDPTKACTGAGERSDYCNPDAFNGTVATLFHNLGGAGARFENVTLRSGLGRSPGKGLGVACFDADRDRWPDVLVANDGQANHLWVNQRDGTFREDALLRGLAYDGLGQARANMGVALGDGDGDGLADVFIPHLADELPALWRADPVGDFQDVTGVSGLAAPRWRGTGFGVAFADFDLDGAPDLAVANGAVYNRGKPAPPGGHFWDPYRERNQLFANDGKGRFRDLSPSDPAFAGTPAVWRALAAGDVDNDGALDLLVTAVAGPARLLRNVAPARGHWLAVRAVDPALGGRDAFGAEVTLAAGGRRRLGLVNPNTGYLATNAPHAHFGLGTVDRADSLEVVWPDGTAEVFPGGGVDRLVVLAKGGGRPGKDGGP